MHLKSMKYPQTNCPQTPSALIFFWRIGNTSFRAAGFAFDRFSGGSQIATVILMFSRFECILSLLQRGGKYRLWRRRVHCALSTHRKKRLFVHIMQRIQWNDGEKPKKCISSFLKTTNFAQTVKHHWNNDNICSHLKYYVFVLFVFPSCSKNWTLSVRKAGFYPSEKTQKLKNLVCLCCKFVMYSKHKQNAKHRIIIHSWLKTSLCMHSLRNGKIGNAYQFLNHI